MRTPTDDQLFSALEATWPPASVRDIAGWRLRYGRGGGKRVSAATRISGDARIEEAIASLRESGQMPLFRLHPWADEHGDDAALAALGFDKVDPTLIRTAPLSALATDADPRRQVIEGSGRLALMEAIWAQDGIGPARLAVMDRTGGARCFLLARAGDRPAGVAFVARSADICMLHALVVDREQRRKGVGRMLTQAAAHWAARQNAAFLALAVTEANKGANALYEQLGLSTASRYHYRISPN